MHPVYTYIKNELANHYSATECSALARWILSDVFHLSVTEIYSNKDDDFSANNGEKLANIINRLKLFEPMQYILRQTVFCGMPFEVSPEVLIPRPETEELVQWIVETNDKPKLNVLDIGTGSGCIAISLAKNLHSPTVTACDISAKALDVAKRNAANLNAPVTFLQTDILKRPSSLIDYVDFAHARHTESCRFSLHSLNHKIPHSSLKYDIVVSNPPYITDSERKDMSPNVLDWEPPEALFVPDSDPLLFYRRISLLSQDLLHSDGKLYFEINRLYGDSIVYMLETLGYVDIIKRKDLSGNDRFIKAIRP